MKDTDQLMLGQSLGERRKEQGIAQVNGHHAAWCQQAASCLERFVAGRQAPFTMADFRRHASASLPNPEHPNAWGGVLYHAANRGLIRKTGRYLKSDLPAAHARVIAEWEPV